MAGNSRGRVSLLGCHGEVNAGARPVATKALFFHYSGVALAIVEIAEGKLAEIDGQAKIVFAPLVGCNKFCGWLGPQVAGRLATLLPGQSFDYGERLPPGADVALPIARVDGNTFQPQTSP